MRGQHFTRNTVEAEAWCNKCNRRTMHRIDGVKRGPCLVCIVKLEEAHSDSPEKAEPKQEGFEF